MISSFLEHLFWSNFCFYFIRCSTGQPVYAGWTTNAGHMQKAFGLGTRSFGVFFGSPKPHCWISTRLPGTCSGMAGWMECSSSQYPSTLHDLLHQTMCAGFSTASLSLSKFWGWDPVLIKLAFDRAMKVMEVCTKSLKRCYTRVMTKLGLLKLFNNPFQKVSGIETHNYPKLAACKSKGHIEAFQLPFWFFHWTSISNIHYIR